MSPVRDGQRSRQRLLEAATAEFAAFGIAGARVDRIAATAGVNKAQMYGRYGSKEGLFEATFAEHLHRIVDAVPFTPDDLPAYAVALYDSYVADPELVRLASWNRLERVPTGELLAAHPGLADSKHAAIARAQGEGRVMAGIRPDEALRADHRAGRHLVAGQRDLHRVAGRQGSRSRAPPGGAASGCRAGPCALVAGRRRPAVATRRHGDESPFGGLRPSRGPNGHRGAGCCGGGDPPDDRSSSAPRPRLAAARGLRAYSPHMMHAAARCGAYTCSTADVLVRVGRHEAIGRQVDLIGSIAADLAAA